MNRSPRFFGLGSSVLMWVGGALLLCATMWLLLLIREYHGSLFTADAAPTNDDIFWTDQTLVGVIASAFAMAIGSVLLLIGYYGVSSRRHHRHRGDAHPTQSMEAVPANDSEPGVSADEDEMVSFDSNDSPRETLLPADTPGALPPPGKVKIRVKRRVRVRIRKQKD